MCVDGGTGELLWESQEIEVRHLLGVIEDRLVFAAAILAARNPRGRVYEWTSLAILVPARRWPRRRGVAGPRPVDAASPLLADVLGATDSQV